jgi:hypothetical protein
MTVHADVPIPLPGDDELGPTATKNRSARMLGSARSLFLHGLAVLGGAILLGIAEALSLWMGALLVALGLLVVAGGVALTGVLSRFGVRPRH